MSQTSSISKSWSLLQFRSQFQSMKVTNDLINSQTGEVFKSCAFIGHDGSVTLVGFSSKLTSINMKDTPQAISKQISAQKDHLQVVQLESGNYKLCSKGEDTWAEVIL